MLRARNLLSWPRSCNFVDDRPAVEILMRCDSSLAICNSASNTAVACRGHVEIVVLDVDRDRSRARALSAAIPVSADDKRHEGDPCLSPVGRPHARARRRVDRPTVTAAVAAAAPASTVRRVIPDRQRSLAFRAIGCCLEADRSLSLFATSCWIHHSRSVVRSRAHARLFQHEREVRLVEELCRPGSALPARC